MTIAISIDTHKATLAACAVDEIGRAVAEATFTNDPPGHIAFITWARSLAQNVTVGLEGSSSFGASFAWSVQRAGLEVREVPPHLSRVERQRTRRPGKSDPGDALAIARVTAREAHLPPIQFPSPGWTGDALSHLAGAGAHATPFGAARSPTIRR